MKEEDIDLAQLQKEVNEMLGKLEKRLEVSRKKKVLSNKVVKVKITDSELYQRVLDKKPVSYQMKWIRCGKKNCSKCPHGSYVYAYWRSEKTGRVRSKYIGKLRKGEKMRVFVKGSGDNVVVIKLENKSVEVKKGDKRCQKTK